MRIENCVGAQSSVRVRMAVVIALPVLVDAIGIFRLGTFITKNCAGAAIYRVFLECFCHKTNRMISKPARGTIKRSRRSSLMGRAAVLIIMAATTTTEAFSPPSASSAGISSNGTNRRVLRRRRTCLAVGFAPDMMSSPDVSSATVQHYSTRSALSSSLREKHHDPNFYITNPQHEQQPRAVAAAEDWLASFALPVLSSALLITGNTVGAGCLVLPELVAAGPGLLGAGLVFVASWFINVLSAFVLAEVAITQKERAQDAAAGEVPASFQEFAQVSLGSRSAGLLVGGLSFFVNTCVLSFDLSRAGLVGGQLAGCPGAEAFFAAAVAAALVTAMTTLSMPQLSSISTVCVGVLFLSFGGLLIPGLAGVSDVVGTILQPGLAPDVGTALSQCAPIILMSLVFQNIVPTVTKLHNYDRTKTAASIVLGSFLPLVMYLSWCLACLGGGVDTATLSVSGSLMTVFSIATLGGSGLCGAVSMAEELETLHKPTSRRRDGEEQHPAPQPAFRITSSLAAMSIPLAAAVFLNNDGAGLTGALSLAGSFGSPLLYGAIPAAMAWRQQQQQQEAAAVAPTQQRRSTMDLAPAASLPILATLSVGFVGQELVARTQEVFAFI
jgi:tyrosine-specific transport protein